MRVTNDGLADHNLNQLLYEENEVSLLEQYLEMTMDGSLALADGQVYPSTDCIKERQLFQGPTNNDMSWQFAQFSSDVHDFPVGSAEFGGEVHTNKKAMSSAEIVKVAGAQYMRASVNGGDDEANFFAIPALPREVQNGIELARLLLSSVEMISNNKYDQAARLLSQCKNFSSQLGNTIERLAYYFFEALQEKIERQISGELKKVGKPDPDFSYNFDSGRDENGFYGLVAFYTKVLPYAKVLQFTSVQAIIDAVGNAKRIHVIDLGIRTGCQWTVLIQSLALRASSSSLELLKITAVGMNGKELKDSGRRLHEFAKSLAVPFSYRIVEISNMEEFEKGLLNVRIGEAVAVYAPTVLRNLLYKPILLDNVVNAIKKLRPRIMVNMEVEAEHNSPSFVNRFIEVLFYCSTYFDSLDVILPDRHDIQRIKFEEVFCGNQIRNMIACEGEDRRVRHVGTDIWRCFFRKAGFKEMSFSNQAWYQAKLLLKGFPLAECYSLESNGSAITVGWKGTPLHAISAWTCK